MYIPETAVWCCLLNKRLKGDTQQLISNQSLTATAAKCLYDNLKIENYLFHSTWN